MYGKLYGFRLQTESCLWHIDFKVLFSIQSIKQKEEPMKTTRKRILVFVLVAAALLLTASGAFANTRTGGGGVTPFYARIVEGEIINDGEWAVIIFYHPPDCVPDNFNLLVFFDYSAVTCDPTTDGFTIWSGEPWVSAPIQMKLQQAGLVPVWFVKLNIIEAAVEDGILNMPELETLPTLVRGSADLYTETLHPSEAVKVPMINYVAQGHLEDGQSFYVYAVLVYPQDPANWSVWNVQIRFE
jgi:hypothetical protein